MSTQRASRCVQHQSKHCNIGYFLPRWKIVTFLKVAQHLRVLVWNVKTDFCYFFTSYLYIYLPPKFPSWCGPCGCYCSSAAHKTIHASSFSGPNLQVVPEPVLSKKSLRCSEPELDSSFAEALQQICPISSVSVPLDCFAQFAGCFPGCRPPICRGIRFFFTCILVIIQFMIHVPSVQAPLHSHHV